MSGLTTALRQIDERYVPRAAALLRHGIDSARATRRTARGRVVAAWDALLAPAPAGQPGALRRLDERFASRGPLAVMRDIPQLGLLVIAGLFLTGAGVALARSGPGNQDARQSAQSDQTPDILGPAAGLPITPYLDEARARAAKLSREEPDRDHVGLVLLSRYLTPKDTLALLREVQVRRVYLRAQIPDQVSEILSADTMGDVESQLDDLYAETARRKTADQKEFRGLAASIEPQTKEEAQFKQFYADASLTAGKEAAAYRSGCACVFGVVVEGPARLLAELPSLSGVRGVDIAPPGRALADLTVMPLLPENTGTVRPLPRPGGGVDG
ncbi:MAG TPA: hypothetical protein VNA30_01210 [Mycobacteriales bacterium]|nr:hypothetical protein [Mycobacteriales bacterium]